MQGKQGSRNAVLFGLAYLLSAFGYEFMVFVMTVHIYDLTGSAMNVGLFTALTFLPRLFSPYYGSLSDRYPRGRIFSVASIGIALGVFLVAGIVGVEKVLIGGGTLALVSLAALQMKQESPVPVPPVTTN